MRLSRYGIVLETLTSDHLEMVRLWRNQEFVRCNMQFKDLLSREDQEKWFSQLNQNRNLYWVIRTHDYPIGLIHIKELDDECTVGEAGIFIGEPSYLDMPQSILAILFMMEMAFLALGLKRLKAKIRSGNQHAISFNSKLGYQLEPGQPEGFQYYTVNSDGFMGATEQLRKNAQKMYGTETVVVQVNDQNKLGKSLIDRLRKESYFNPKFV
ncbi:MAG: GNAT family N-acetyltransferase [Flavobacteriales bacterium]|nr:GNAT family N-acetyltransferase [Flavobacteriales bacterium]MCB9204203.1 GNAT family N-acetyltransferase [Flavobacteriales bacterium]